jgi:LysR family transcriptional regulator, regulator for genes of the gallate degradation pathway
MDIDPRHLRILRAIAEQGSFTRAAAAQRISQPALSAGIAQLERKLGVRVLERGRHGARLNEFGQLLIRHARGLDALLDQAKAEIDLKRLGYAGPLLIGGTPVTLIELVPAAIEQIARGHRRVSITVMEGVDAALLEKLRAGEIDVMVSGVGHTSPPADVVQEPLLELRFDAVVNARHPLAGRKVMSLRELADEQWALPTPGSAFRRHLEGMFVAAAAPFPESCWACDSLLALKALVTRASCVSILPWHAVALEARTGALRRIRLRDAASMRQIGSTTLRTRAPSPLAEHFLSALRRVASTIA